MPAPPTEPYPEWSLNDNNAGKYEFGSKVSYKQYGITSGYRANSLYVKANTLPPPENAGWTYDKYYALEWSPSRKYQIGDKVWYEVGDPTKYSKYYIYLASPRYFGGTAPPNEEEDLDGIRTWELYFEANDIKGTTFTIPMRNKSGHLGSINSKTGQIMGGESTYNDDKAAPDAFTYSSEPSPEQASSLSRITSIFEGGPYDEYVYEFWNYDSYGARKSHRKRGIHRAQLVKEGKYGYPSSYKNIAERQWIFTSYPSAGYYNRNHFPYLQNYPDDRPPSQYYFKESYGFSVEMWQSAPDSEVELVTRSMALTQQNPYNWSSFSQGNKFEFNPYTTGGGAFGGDTHPETGVTIPSQGGKIEFFAYMNCPTFHARKVTFYLYVSEQSYYWKKYEVTVKDPNTGVEETFVSYGQVYNEIAYSTKTLSFNTSDASYKYEAIWKIGEQFFTAGPRTSILVGYLGHSFS